MYKLSEIVEPSAQELWQGKVACRLVNSSQLTEGFSLDGVMVFSFLLVMRGSLFVDYDGRRIDLYQGDLHTYAPGVPTTMLGVSEDYEALLLIIDEQMVYDTPALQHYVRAAYFQTAELGQPKLTLTGPQVSQLSELLMGLRRHIMQPSLLQ